MKSVVTVAMLFFSTLLVAQGSSTTVFHSDGAFAEAFPFVNGTSVFLQVNRGTTFTGSPATFLFYDSFTFSGDGFTDTFASGVIPDNDFAGDNPAHLALNVDTSQLSDFNVQSCTFSFVDFTFTCVPGPRGVIQLEWRQNQFFNNHGVADSQETFFQVRLQQHTESDSGFADVSGSFLGLPVSNTFAEAGVSHNSSVDIFRTH